MKLSEIYLSSSRDEYNENYVHYFTDVPVIAKIHNLVLKRYNEPDGDIHYGLFDPTTNILISYLHLLKLPNCYQVSLPSTMVQYRNQGWMTYLYDYAVLNDKLTLMSDEQQTPEARKLWCSLARNGRYKIYMLDTRDGSKIRFNSEEMNPWSEKNEGHTRLVTEEHLPEYLAMVEAACVQRGPRAERRKAGRDHLYGPGTSSALFFTY